MSAGARSGGGANQWLVTAAVVLPTFMEILDTTIANVALRYIAGGLSASNADSQWVITSYLAANATILPLSAWLAAHFGRRNYFVASILVFTLASGLCGQSTSLLELILFRVLQGFAGGGLQPMSQGILLDTFPPEKQGYAQTAFGVAVLLGPIVGPVLGGYLADGPGWRWIFYINIPIGLLAAFACYHLVEDPPEVEAQRRALRKQPIRLDWIGLGMLVLMMASWETFLSKGQQWNWWGDPFGRVQTLEIVFVACLAGLILRNFTAAEPVVDFRPLADRNFAVGCVLIFCVYGMLYAASTSLPALLQNLFHYNAYVSGLVMAPSGAFAIIPMVIGGIFMAKGVDTRYLIGAGLVLAAAGLYLTAISNLSASPFWVGVPRVVFIFGTSLAFSPISVAAFKYIPPQARAAAVGLFSLLRNEGGSVGTSMAQTIEDRRQQFHVSRLSDHLTPFDKPVQSFLARAYAGALSGTGDPGRSRTLAYAALNQELQQQSMALSYFDVFAVCTYLAIGLTLMVFLLKPSRSEGGADAAAG